MTSRLFLVLMSALAVVNIACGDSDTPTSPSANVAYSQTDLVVGTGAEATAGRSVTVAYSLWLYDANAPQNKGTAVQTNQYTFTLGANQVIRGWDQGIPGMRVGGQRRLVIPPSLAYGSAGSPPSIPGNTALVFDVQLLSVQ